jgi:hypothetical protein
MRAPFSASQPRSALSRNSFANASPGVRGDTGEEPVAGTWLVPLVTVDESERKPTAGFAVPQYRPDGSDRQTYPVGHAPQLAAHRVTAGSCDQLADDVSGERTAVHADGEQLLGLTQRHHRVIATTR